MDDFASSQTATFPTSGAKTISGLDPSTTYYFRAKALADGTSRVDSAWTAAVSKKTSAFLGVLATPGLALSTTKTAIVAKITATPNAAKYVVEYGTDPTFANCLTKAYPTAGTKTISGITSGTAYFVRIRATAPGYADSDPLELTATTTGAPASSAVLDLDAAFENYLDEDFDEFWDLLAETVAK